MQVGSAPVLTAEFLDDNDEYTAATDVSLGIVDPAGTSTDYPAPTLDDVGRYSQLIAPFDAAGFWYWTWQGTITATGAIVKTSGTICVT